MKHSFSRSVLLFLSAHGASAFSLGIHQVLLAWLSVNMLHLQGHELGWVQAAGLLPNLLFMLISGALADKHNAYRLLAKAQFGLSVCYLLLAGFIFAQSLSLVSLLVYASGVGIANAFLQPVREKVIGELSEQPLQRKITRASLVQFALQALGVLAAALADKAGFVAVVAVQAMVSLLAAIQYYRLYLVEGRDARETQTQMPQSPHLFAHISEAMSVAVRDVRIAQLIGLISFNGFMHLGLYIVAVPLFARDVYGFSTLQYGFLQFGFIAGMLLAYLILMFKTKIQYPGQGALFSLLYTAILGFALAKAPTLTGLYILIVFWGWVAGHSATHCRMVLQVLAKPGMKGRLMSLYQIMLFGMAPLGALATGYLANSYTIASLFKVMSITSVVMFVFFLFTRSLWSVKCE